MRLAGAVVPRPGVLVLGALRAEGVLAALIGIGPLGRIRVLGGIAERVMRLFVARDVARVLAGRLGNAGRRLPLPPHRRSFRRGWGEAGARSCWRCPSAASSTEGFPSGPCW